MDLCIDSVLPVLSQSITDVEPTEAGGDLAAKAEEEWLRDAWRFAYSLTGGNHSETQDLVQEAAMRLYRKYGKLRHRGALFTTVRNIFYDQLRRKKIVAFDSLDDPDSNLPEPAARASDPGGQGDLVSMLESLAPKEREAVFLHYVSGYSAREIGELTHQPRNSILSLLRRARQKLESHFMP